MRRPVDAKSVKRASSQKRVALPASVISDSVASPHGLKTDLFSSRFYEVVQEVFASYTSTALIKHPKKDRQVYVVDGAIHLLLDGKEAVLHSGAFVDIPRGTPYLISSAQDSTVLFVQGAKYEDGVEILEDREVQAVGDFMDRVQAQEVETQSRPTTRAREQAAAQGAKRKEHVAMLDAMGPATSGKGLNARPSLGRFDEAEAG